MEEKKREGSSQEAEHAPEETPEVYTVEKDLVGWRFNRRAFLAAAGTATAAAVVGSAAGCDDGGQGPVQVVDVIVDVTATEAPPSATLAAKPEESKAPEETPKPADTQPPTEPPKADDTSTATSTVAPTPTSTEEPPQAEFVRDVTIPDGTVMRPNQSFTKTWRYRNIGNGPWGEGVKLVFVPGTIQGYQSNRMGGPGRLG